MLNHILISKYHESVFQFMISFNLEHTPHSDDDDDDDDDDK